MCVWMRIKIRWHATTNSFHWFISRSLRHLSFLRFERRRKIADRNCLFVGWNIYFSARILISHLIHWTLSILISFLRRENIDVLLSNVKEICHQRENCFKQEVDYIYKISRERIQSYVDQFLQEHFSGTSFSFCFCRGAVSVWRDNYNALSRYGEFERST